MYTEITQTLVKVVFLVFVTRRYLEDKNIKGAKKISNILDVGIVQ